MTTKTFDCVEMKRQGAERLQEKLAGMTRDERLAYWAERNEQFKAKCAKRREERESR